jgi:hypothetical protein
MEKLQLAVFRASNILANSNFSLIAALYFLVTSEYHLFPRHHDFKFCASYKLSDGIRAAVFDGYCESPIDSASNFDAQVLKPFWNILKPTTKL